MRALYERSMRAHWRPRCAWASALGLAWAALVAVPQSAAAYCRASVETSPLGPCDELPGVPLLHWTRGCVHYAFHRDFFRRMPRLTEQQIRADYVEAFDQYRAVDCGQRPFEAIQLPELASAEHAEFQWDVENESVMAVRTASEWSELGYDDRAVALTLLFFDPDNGEIYDVDMELNAGAGQFIRCVDECIAGEVDLPSTLAHEVGHYLGLGHSTVPGSTMLPRADRGLERRTLEDDDRDGYCALELPQPELAPEGEEPRCATPVYSRIPDPKPEPMKMHQGCATVQLSSPDRSGRTGVLLMISAPACALARRRRRAAARVAWPSQPAPQRSRSQR